MASIIVVEDNPDNMKLFRAVLAVRGHDVTGLPGGDDLLRVVKEKNPQLVLLDIQLPGADGFTLLGMLRRALGRAAPKIVALTAHAMSGDREKALAAGFDAYMTKPINVTTFAQEIEGYLQG